MSFLFTHFFWMIKNGPDPSVNFSCSFPPTFSCIPILHVQSKRSRGWSLQRWNHYPHPGWTNRPRPPAQSQLVSNQWEEKRGLNGKVVSRCWLSTSRKQSSFSFGCCSLVRSSLREPMKGKEWMGGSEPKVNPWTPNTTNLKNRHFTDEKTWAYC